MLAILLFWKVLIGRRNRNICDSEFQILHFQVKITIFHSLILQFQQKSARSQFLIPEFLQISRSSVQTLLPKSFVPQAFSTLKVI